MIQLAIGDWEGDLRSAREAGAIGKHSQVMNFEAYYLSVYELVDNWTETADLYEYILMV